MPHVRGTSHPKVFLESAFPSSTALHPPVLEPTISRHRQRPVTVSQQFALPRSRRGWSSPSASPGVPRRHGGCLAPQRGWAGRKERPRPQRSHPRSARWPSREKSASTREIPRDSLQQSEQPKSGGSRVERRKVTSRARSRTGAAAAPGGSGSSPGRGQRGPAGGRSRRLLPPARSSSSATTQPTSRLCSQPALRNSRCERSWRRRGRTRLMPERSFGHRAGPSPARRNAGGGIPPRQVTAQAPAHSARPP